MTWHRLIGQDDGVSCITCGAYFETDEMAAGSTCTGRTDLVHPINGDGDRTAAVMIPHLPPETIRREDIALEDVEFDHVFQVIENGGVIDAERGRYYAPEVYHSETDDIDILPDDWEALKGYTGQDSYNGAVMHSSEYMGGKLADDILSEPGIYVKVVVEVSCNDDCDDCVNCNDCEIHNHHEPAGWAVLRHKTDGKTE